MSSRAPLAVFAWIALASAVLAEGEMDWRQMKPLPEALGVAGAYAGIAGDALLVAGGANFPAGMPWDGGTKVWRDTVWMLDRPDGDWRTVGALPRALGYGVAVSHRGTVVCAGGSDAKAHHADVFRLRWRDDVLETERLPALPIPLAGASGALVSGTLIVACGAREPGEREASNRVFALDLDGADARWKELPPLPSKPRLLATAASHAGTFYLFGGAALEDGDDGKVRRVYLRETWSYHASHGWRRLADMPKPNVAAPAPAPFVGGKFLLLGGDDGSRVGFQPLRDHPGFPRTVHEYDPVSDRWTATGEAPASRVTVPCVQWGARWVLPSGESRPGVRSPEIWSFTLRPVVR